MSEKKKEKPSAGIHMIKRQIYAREESDELKRRTEELGNPPRSKFRAVRGNARPGLVNVIEERTKRRKIIFKWASIASGVVLVFVIAVGGTLWFRSSRQVASRHVNISVDAPASFTAGEEIIYSITYRNDSHVDWENVDVLFTPPEGFIYRSSEPQFQLSGKQYILSAGYLEAGEERTLRMIGQLLGEQGATALAGIEVAVSPKNFPKARISNTETFITTISAVPIDVSIEANENAATGERMSAVIRMRNMGSVPIGGMILKLSPAPGVKLAVEDTGFSPDFSVPDSWWELPTVGPLDEIERFVAMYVDGIPGDKRSLDAEFFVRDKDNAILLSRVSHVVTISASELVVSQEFNGNSEDHAVNAEERIEGVVTYKNTGTSGLTDVIVTVEFDGVGIDPSSIKLKKGAYDPNSRTITWSAASVPELATLMPGQGGAFDYTFSILPIEGIAVDESGKNASLMAKAVVDSPDLPTPTGQARRVISDRVMMSINSGLTLSASAFYDDGRLGLESSGPLPPEVGQQTTYTLRFQLGSTLNDVGDVKMRAVLPDGVSYMGKTYKTAGDVEVNERSGEILWSVPMIEGLVGRTKPPIELHVQIGITPGENLRGEEVSFLNSASVEGTDVFTDESVSADASEREFPSTKSASPQNGRVQ